MTFKEKTQKSLDEIEHEGGSSDEESKKSKQSSFTTSKQKGKTKIMKKKLSNGSKLPDYLSFSSMERIFTKVIDQRRADAPFPKDKDLLFHQIHSHNHAPFQEDIQNVQNIEVIRKQSFKNINGAKNEIMTITENIVQDNHQQTSQMQDLSYSFENSMMNSVKSPFMEGGVDISSSSQNESADVLGD